MGRKPKKEREPLKRYVSLVELREQQQALRQQTDLITLAVEKLSKLQVPQLGVKGPARIQRGVATINSYLADLTGAVTRLELDGGGQGTSSN